MKDYKGNAHKCLMAKAMVEDGEDQNSLNKVKVTPRSNPPLFTLLLLVMSILMWRITMMMMI